jgi:hypothetical protein
MARTEAEKEAIYRLRYQVYIEEMNGADRHLEADGQTRQLRDEWDERAHHFYVLQDGVMAACARVILRRDGPMECEHEFELEKFAPAFPNHVCMTSRLALHPTIRGSHILKQLTCAIYQFWCEQDVQFSFLDCHTRLLPLYSRLGFRTYRSGFNHSKYTYVIPMVLVVPDVEYLEEVKSPFAPIGRRFFNGRRPASYRSALSLPQLQLPDQGGNGATTDDLLRRLLGPAPDTSSSEMLEGLTLEDVRLLVSLGHIIPCRTGSVVLREGDPSREIFLILDGRFEVRGRTPASPSAEPIVQKILMPGDVFGEIRFLTEGIRYASVVAVEESTVLILNAKAMDRLVFTAPKMAAKVIRNLARIVVSRLCHTSTGVDSGQ